MKAKIAGVALAAVVACGCAGGAEAGYIEASGYSDNILYFGKPVGTSEVHIQIGFTYLGTYPFLEYAAVKVDSTKSIYMYLGDDGYGSVSFSPNLVSGGASYDGGQHDYIGGSVKSSSAGLRDGYSYLLNPEDEGLFRVDFSYEDYTTNQRVSQLTLSFRPDEIRYTTLSGVPLPSSAPLMGAALLALGGIGYARRRSREITAR